MVRNSGRTWGGKIKPLSEERKREIAKYIVKNQNKTHKERAYYLGLNYNTYLYVFHEMIAIYQVYIIKEDIINSLTEKSLFQTGVDTSFEK